MTSPHDEQSLFLGLKKTGVMKLHHHLDKSDTWSGLTKKATVGL